MMYLIGVDGGGTGCRAVVADSAGRVLGQGAAGPANATTDPAQAIANSRTAIAAALTAAGLGAETLQTASAHLGLAGALSDEILQRIASEIGIARVTVSDDLRTTAAGALGARDGVVAAVGTGSVLAALQGGSLRRVGGWGLQVSDQASGAWLGRALLERVLLCHDGVDRHSDLTMRVLAHLGGDPVDVVRFATTARPADYARFAPDVVSSAKAGDAQAKALMVNGAAYLGGAINMLAPRGSEAVCLTGGLGPEYARHLPGVVQARLIPPQGTALDGALMLARHAPV